MLIKMSDNALKLCSEVIGQLSDGLWENSPRMMGYWMFAKVTKNGLEIDESPWHEYGYRTTTKNLFRDKSEEEIKKWFASKIRAVLKSEAEYYPDTEWKLGNFENSKFLHCPIDDVVKAYNELRGK